MRWQYTPYALPLALAAVVAATFVILAWRLRSMPTAKSFALMMLGLVVWTLGLTLSYFGADLPTKLFWSNVMYLGIVTVPTAFLAFALKYAGYGEWLTRRTVSLLTIEPIVTLLLVWSNNLHGWYWTNRWLDTSGPIAEFQFERGVGSWANLVYTFALVLLAFLLLAQAFLRAPRLYRAQVGAVLLGALGVLAVNVIVPNRLTQIPTPVLALFVVTLTGLTFTVGLFRFRLLDIVPVARATVIERMNDGVIVLDAQERVVDLNPAAQSIVNVSASEAIGQSAVEIFSQWPDLVVLCRAAATARIELVIGEQDARRHYDVHLTPLFDERGRLTGRVIVFNEITELKRAQHQLLQHQRSLAMLEERDRLARELHDSLGQVLGYVNTQAQAIRELLSSGRTTDADAHLARLANVARDAAVDVRDYIFSVRTALSAEQDFFRTLEQYLARFSENYGIHTELIVPAALKEGAFQPIVEVQLLRIIQEALANVRKHAGARSARVNVSIQDGRAQIVIEDDGCGFDPTQVAESGQHFGTRIMRERAEEVGGSLRVESAPGRGTQVIVQVPLRADKM